MQIETVDSNNPFIIPPEEAFAVGSSDFADCEDITLRNENGAILLCIGGSAEVEIAPYRGTIRRNTLATLLPGTSLRFTRRTGDFRMKYFLYTPELFVEIAGRFDPAFFRILREHPLFDLPESMVEGMTYWFEIVEYTYRDRENIFRNTITRNRLQNLFLDSYDKLQRFSAQFQQHRNREISGRQNELMMRFMSLVREHCSRERSVAFYADKLCISTRYLAAIVRNTAHEPVKAIIDRAVILEIKERLQSTELSVQEIAYLLHFPDQSYLGRFFKKHTGQSPSAFRNSHK